MSSEDFCTNDMQWRVCAGHPQYEISEYGHLRRLTSVKGFKAGRVSKPIRHSRGYLQYAVSKHKKELMHRLVVQTFIGAAPSTDHEVAHYDGTRTNNHVSNLRWASRAENQSDRKRHGTYFSGERIPTAKITNTQASSIIERYAEGGVRYRGGPVIMQQLADEYGISITQISRIVNGKQKIATSS